MPLLLQTLTPTARLVLLTLEKLKRPLTYMELAIETGCSLASVQVAVPILERRNMVSRITGGSVSEFVLNQEAGAM